MTRKPQPETAALAIPSAADPAVAPADRKADVSEVLSASEKANTGRRSRNPVARVRDEFRPRKKSTGGAIYGSWSKKVLTPYPRRLPTPPSGKGRDVSSPTRETLESTSQKQVADCGDTLLNFPSTNAAVACPPRSVESAARKRTGRWAEAARAVGLEVVVRRPDLDGVRHYTDYRARGTRSADPWVTRTLGQ